MEKVLVTDGVHPSLITGLESDGYVVDYEPNISLEAVRERVGAYVGMVINSKILVDRQMLDAGVQLRFVGRLGSGLEIIDLDYAREKSVAVISAPEGNRNAVAEHALGMLLALANKLLIADGEVRQKIWRREAMRGFELHGKTIGIIGFGNTGSCFATKLDGMGMNILAYDKYLPFFGDRHSNVGQVSLAELQSKADIISFHLPLTPETRHFADASFIEDCKEGVIFINTSRGNVISTLDMVEALDRGKIGGACLDVFENEKPKTFTNFQHEIFSRLYAFPNVILSPHVAGWTVESKRRLAEIVLARIRENNKMNAR